MVPVLNQANMSGKIITDFVRDEKAVSFTVKQRLAAKVSLTFKVRCINEAAKAFDEIGLSRGAEIYLIGVMLYQKEGDPSLVAKVRSTHQIINMTQRKESLDLGVERF